MSPKRGDRVSVPALVNEPFAGRVDRIARRGALRELLSGWERSVGPVGADEASAAAAAFDELEGVGPCGA